MSGSSKKSLESPWKRTLNNASSSNGTKKVHYSPQPGNTPPNKKGDKPFWKEEKKSRKKLDLGNVNNTLKGLEGVSRNLHKLSMTAKKSIRKLFKK